MNRTYLIGALVVVVLGLGIIGVLYTGIGPGPGGESGETISDFPTATDTTNTVDSGDSQTTAPTETPPFTFEIDDIEQCGTTCRDVTATLSNNQNETATGVTVFTRIFIGENNTNTKDLVWEGKDDIGTLEGGGTATTTKRIELSFQEARSINQNDGWITIMTTVQSDETTVTFKDSEPVV